MELWGRQYDLGFQGYALAVPPVPDCGGVLLSDPVITSNWPIWPLDCNSLRRDHFAAASSNGTTGCRARRRRAAAVQRLTKVFGISAHR